MPTEINGATGVSQVQNGVVSAPKLSGGQAGNPPAFACRAWGIFDGTTATILGGGNFASVVRNGVGDYTVNLATAMPSANYAVAITTSANAGGGGYSHLVNANTTSSFRFQCWTVAGGNTLRDSVPAMFAVFG